MFHESLYYGKTLDHLLINPNQLRTYGIPLLWDNPFDPMHTLGTKVDDSFHIPLRAYGTKVGFRTRVPTPLELQSCEHISMTSSCPWNPSAIVMVQATDQGGSHESRPWKRRLESATNAFTHAHEYLDSSSDEALLHSIDPARRTLVSNERHVKISAELIAKRFGIGPLRAQKTMRVTT